MHRTRLIIPRILLRHASTTSSGTPAEFRIFDRAAKQRQRDRAAADEENSRVADYLKDEVAERVVDRLLDVKRKFNTIVDLGSGCGHIEKFIEKDVAQKIIMCDISRKMLERDKDIKYNVEVERRVVDEEFLPFEEDSLDAVVSSMSLHWVNDLPGALIQIRRSLKPDSPFICAILGGDTLFELRTSLQLTEQEREGGLSPRVSPMTTVRDVGSLLSRAGFNLTTIDVDDIVVNYPSMFELITDLRSMGESNAVIARRPYLTRDNLIAASAVYKELYGDSDGNISATFQVIYMIGWKPHTTQPRPMPRGSAKVSMKETFEKDESKD
ncbi:4929_t:CDS:2 [Paraglomus brasilianum]|uniref:4929_t:CDS:1 n=1 Tax=Paraglomus brasilianum TaxID=144538 RepID=A0A9N9CTY7_9GLOM|nr:4929_t:CDS:2 [Paraglomus brasilianum]